MQLLGILGMFFLCEGVVICGVKMSGKEKIVDMGVIVIVLFDWNRFENV